MKISDEDKKQILQGFIDIFTRIASKEYQQRVWLQGEGSEVDDFDDTVCDFFGECDSILENYKEFSITKKQYQLIKNFREDFEKFSEKNYWPIEFIHTLAWEKIVQKAKEVLKEFDYKKNRS